MSIPVKIDQVEVGLKRLLEQFRDSPNITKILTVYLSAIQKLEDTSFQLLEERNVHDAVGVNLDNIGKLVLEPRRGRTDEEYRVAILLRIAIFSSVATPEDLIQTLKVISEEGSEIRYWEHYPASSVLYTNSPTLPNKLAEAINLATPAGTSDLYILWDEFDNGFTPVELIDGVPQFKEEGLLAEFSNEALQVRSGTGTIDNLVASDGSNVVFDTGDNAIVDESALFSNLQVIDGSGNIEDLQVRTLTTSDLGILVESQFSGE